ncbi:uncharacterized protein LOC123005523 [Tribolium madens]|uniref:uncharacterized protein LOC123005523 n=1 Tax=Tribolium madens TaxID=41895 RepID=UPI001CF7549A|nr:uncharacterized protein LOC123005523 [Tribolium madens]
MKLVVLALWAIVPLTVAQNDSSNDPAEILPIVLPPDGPQLLWHAFQSFVANANNPDRPLENLIEGSQGSGNCGSTTTSESPEVTTQTRQKQKSHAGVKHGRKAAKTHAKHKSTGKYHKKDKNQAHH